ncbi:MAG: hypothetical protein RLZZ458_720, partial [Planctomycetota bacterium]
MSAIPGTMSTANDPAGAVDDTAEDFQDSGFWALFDTVPAWGVSVLVHVGIFLVLLTVTLPDIILPEISLSSTIEQEEVRVEEYVIDSQPTEQLGSMSTLNIQGASAAVAQNKGL